MDNRRLRRAQVILEFTLAFIVVLLLFVGGFKIWSNLNSAFIEETTKYQGQRTDAGQPEGDIPIPGE